MTDEIAKWGRRIHGPTLPGSGIRCARETALTDAEMNEVVSTIATARAGRHSAFLPEHLRTRHWESTMTAMLSINARLGWPSAGWKIGAASLEVQRAEGMPGASPGQLARDGVHPSPARVPAHLFINYRCAESEFAFQMAHALPARTMPFSEDEVADAVASLHPALEIGRWSWILVQRWSIRVASSPMRNRGARSCMIASAAVEKCPTSPRPT